MYIIPLTSDPNQNLRCTIPVDEHNLTLFFTFKYNTEAAYWVMSAADDISGKVLIDSLPLIAGKYPTANLLGQYTYLAIGSAFIIKANPDNPAAAPNGENFGTDFMLVWGDTLDV